METDKRWKTSRILRRLAGVGALILGERVMFGLLNLAAAALAVRAVGVEAFGVVALLQAYARLSGELAQFQSWQALIRFGAVALHDGRRDTFRSLVGFCARLDLLTLGGAALVAGLAAGPLGRALGWPEPMIALAPWFVISTLFIIPATAHGVLRLFGRVSDIAAQHAIAAVMRFVGAAGLFALGGGAVELAVVWAAAGVASGLWVMARAWRALGAEGLRPQLSMGWGGGGAVYPGVWRFLWTASFSATIQAAVAHGATLAVGAVLGASEAGLFAIARQVADALAKPATLMGPLILPELAWLRARGDAAALRKLTLRCAALALGAVVALGSGFLLAGAPLLRLAFGPQVEGALTVLTLMSAASGFTIVGFALEPTLLSLGRMRAVAVSLAVAATLFCATLVSLLPAIGIAGAGAAMLAFRGALFALRAAAVAIALRRRPPRDDGAAAGAGVDRAKPRAERLEADGEQGDGAARG